LCLIFTVSAVT